MKLRREHIIMGMIQSSLNQLTMSLLGAAIGVGKGLQGGFAHAKAPGVPAKAVVPQSDTKASDYAVQGEATYTVGSPADKSAIMSDVAAMSGNDMIKQKARSSSRKFNERLAMIRKRKMGR